MRRSAGASQDRSWQIRATVGGALLTALVGWVLVGSRAGEALKELSYDLPFHFRSTASDTNVVIVPIDRASLDTLAQPNWPIDRRIYGRLLDRLRADRADLVVFDVHFRNRFPEQDAVLSEAMRRHGRVILSGVLAGVSEQSSTAPGVLGGTILAPNEELRASALGWGVVDVGKADRVLTVRTIAMEINGVPSTVRVAAEARGASPRSFGNSIERWINFRGPPGSFDTVSLARALEPSGVPGGFFRGKVVFVGVDPSLTPLTGQRDIFATPWTRSESSRQAKFLPGVELLAHCFSNLDRGDWLRRIPSKQQTLMAVAWGLLLGAGLVWVRPGLALLIALAAGIGVALLSLNLHVHQLWWTWLVPAAIQPAVAGAWSLLTQYTVVARQRQRLRRAFGSYLTPHLVEQIARSKFDLKPGGHETEATVLFTDLAGFTSLSETLRPEEVSAILTEYFENTTREILRHEGTVIQFIGDAVLAVWGAPLPCPDHPLRALRAAWGVLQAGRREVAGRTLSTRLGLNTGTVLAGNLGCSWRFDYTVIGNTTNVASRLEALNKVFGTELIISAATRARVGSHFLLRPLGRVLVRGTTLPTELYEVLGPAEEWPVPPPWLSLFEQAMDRFKQGRLHEAEPLWEKTLAARSGGDGPSAFYLRWLDRLRTGRVSLRPDGSIDPEEE